MAIPDLVTELVIGGIAAYTAWKARRAEQHTKPNGTGKTISTLMEEISTKADQNRDGVERLGAKMDSSLEWQGEHDSHHVRLRAQYLPALNALVQTMQNDLDDRIEQRDHDDEEDH